MGQPAGKHRGKGDTPRVASLPRVQVLLPLPLAGAYDYRVPSNVTPAPGDFVYVPLNQQEMIGVVWDEEHVAPEAVPVPDHRLRPVTEVLDVPRMTASLRRFVDWVAAYTLSPPGAVLRMAMSAPAALE